MKYDQNDDELIPLNLYEGINKLQIDSNYFPVWYNVFEMSFFYHEKILEGHAHKIFNKPAFYAIAKTKPNFSSFRPHTSVKWNIQEFIKLCQ